MRITIDGAKVAPMWVTTEAIIRQAVDDDDVRLVGIERLDGGVNYRALGLYHLSCANVITYASFDVTLEIKE